MAWFNNNSGKDSKLTIPQRVKHFIFPEETEELFKEVEEYNNFANYSLGSSISSRSVLNALKDVPAMLDDPICGPALKCVMQTAFQPDNEGRLFGINTVYESINNELKAFHESINADDFVLKTGYNCLLWGQLPWKHFFNKDGILERISPIPDFTLITPVIVSGKTVGFINEEGNFVPSYEYTYAQMDFYKNLGGNSQNMYCTIGGTSGNGDDLYFKNEFVYANSYLSEASKPWRNVNIIEDGLLLNRMDQSNYYRIISVNVGGQVYSKSAIQVLNYYRNLFKKVRRVNYDSNGMSSRGKNQEFEVIVPKTQNQGVEIQNVGGDMDIKALKDLDTQYNKLFAALQIQPSMIGFSSDTPSSLGDSAANTWDKRFSKVCKAITFSTFNALKNIDYLHLRSLGYNVTLNDWTYTSVSKTILEDIDKGETLKLASENLEKIAQTLNNMQAEYNKEYLAKSILNDALSNFGVDCEKLFAKETDIGVPEQGSKMIGTSFKKDILENDAHVLVLNGILKEKESKEIVAALTDKNSSKMISERITPMKLKEVASSFAVKRDNPVDLKGIVNIEKELYEDFTSKYKLNSSLGEGVAFKFPVYYNNTEDEETVITAGDLDLESGLCIRNLYIDENGNHHLNSKKDLCAYLCNYMNGGYDNYVSNVWVRNDKLF